MVTRLAQLAAFAATMPPDGVPKAAHTRAAQALVDFVGVAIAGGGEPISRIALGIVETGGASGACTLIGQAQRAGALDAALINGTIGHALDFDDSNFVLGGHPSVTIFPAALALAEKRRASGADLLDAYVIGFEVTVAIARIVNFHHYEKGWHPTATIGIIGAAAAACRLLRLDAGRTEMALGLAASMASGIKQNFGTMAKPLQVGHAAQKGLLCALLAAEGATASPEALEGRQGFLNVYNGEGNYSANALESLGEYWELLESGLMFKKYACCGSTHPVIDAAIELVIREDLKADEIESIRVAINPRRIPHVNRPVVETPLQAKFSLQYTAAAALTDRAVGLKHFSSETVRRTDIQRLVARVSVSGLDHVDDELSQACALSLTLHDGRETSLRLAAAKGRRAEDYDQFKRAKFLDCATQVLSAPAAARLFERLEGVGDEADLGGLLAATVPARAANRSRERAEV